VSFPLLRHSCMFASSSFLHVRFFVIPACFKQESRDKLQRESRDYYCHSRETCPPVYYPCLLHAGTGVQGQALQSVSRESESRDYYCHSRASGNPEAFDFKEYWIPRSSMPSRVLIRGLPLTAIGGMPSDLIRESGDDELGTF
jgi:hypothetical protein